jgi:hypothetical protein
MMTLSQVKQIAFEQDRDWLAANPTAIELDSR